MDTKKKHTGGAAALRASGRQGVLIGLTPAQRAIIDAARELDGRCLSNFIVHHAVLAAEKIAAAKSPAKLYNV